MTPFKTNAGKQPPPPSFLKSFENVNNKKIFLSGIHFQVSFAKDPEAMILSSKAKKDVLKMRVEVRIGSRLKETTQNLQYYLT